MADSVRISRRFVKRYGKMMEKTNRYLREENYAKSLKSQHKVIKLTSKKPKYSFYFGHAAIKMAQILYVLKFYEDAIIYYKKACKCFNKANTAINEELYQIYQGLYQCFKELGNLDEIIKYGVLVTNYKDISPEERLEIYGEIARAHVKLFELEGKIIYLIRGVGYAIEAVMKYERMGYTDQSEYYELLITCSDYYYYLRDYDLALEYCEKVEEASLHMDFSKSLLEKLYFLQHKLFNIKGMIEKAQYYRSKLLSL